MKVLALNSSSRSDEISKTKLMLNHLTKGMRNAGAEVEVIDLRNKNIKNCVGCFSCWHKTPGKCVLNDDITNELFPKWTNADIVIYATPLFCHHMNAVLSAFIERLLPIALPQIEKEGDGSTHPIRFELPKIVMLSVCGFPNISEFNIFSNYVKHACDDSLIAEIYRCAAESMVDENYKDKLNEILKATEQAGRELIANQNISKKTLNKIIQPIDEYDKVVEGINNYWDEVIE